MENPSNPESTSQETVTAETSATVETVEGGSGEPTVVTENDSFVEANTPAEGVEAAEVETSSYADGKYKSVGELENGYKELQASYSKKLGGFDGSPEDGYSLGLPEGQEPQYLAGEQEMVSMLQEWGAENQLSQEGFKGLVEGYTRMNDEVNNKRMNAEFEKLGDNANQRLTNVTDFLTQNVGKELTDALAKDMMSANAIMAVEKLIEQTKGYKPAPSGTSKNAQAVSRDKIQEMRFAMDEFGQRKMSNPQYRAQVLKLESQLQG